MIATLTAEPTTPEITLPQLRAILVELAAAYPAHQVRIARAARLLATHTPVAVPNVAGVFTVDSEERAGTYYVVMQGPTLLADGCNCPDAKNRQGVICKHALLVRIWQRCIGCDEPTAARSGDYPMCEPCSDREAGYEQQPRCSRCQEPAALSFGVCGSCAIAQAFQD